MPDDKPRATKFTLKPEVTPQVTEQSKTKLELEQEAGREMLKRYAPKAD